MKNKPHLIAGISGCIAVLVSTVFYFLYKAKSPCPIPTSDIVGILICLVCGVGSAIIGYLFSIGKVTLEQELVEPRPEWGLFRKTLNDPKYSKNLIIVFLLLAPFLIGAGVISDALRGF
jgi:hypothetical protein